MNVLSLFSGAGGMDIGLEAAGHTVVGMCEIDPKCREVLAYRWPDVELHEDVTTLDGSLFRGRVDVVSGGSPCQDLSVAGRRQGLDGARSGLFWHQCRIADQSAARWVLWENVAGALSSNLGTDFAAVLWGLTGTYPRVPDGGWKSCGVVVGPKRWAVWRLLDARWFGVPQRRRRVFVVAGAGGEPRPEILFESACCPRDTPPSGTSQEDVAALTSTGVGVGGPDDNQGQAGHLIPMTAATLEQRYYKGINDPGSHPGHLIPMVAGTLGGGTAGGSKPDVERMTFIPMAAYPLALRGREHGAELEIGEPEIYNTLRGGNGGASTVNAVMRVSAFSENQRGEIVETEYTHALSTGGGKPGVGYPAVHTATSFRWHASGRSGFDVREDHVGTLTVGTGLGIPSPPAVSTQTDVRRLTPLECERLMGWPDSWTAEGINGPIADSHRYRMCGNGVVAPVAEWIGRRLLEVNP